MLKPGALVVFEPVDSFWPAPGVRYPAPGTRGVVLRVPPPGNYGGSVRVRFPGGEVEFGGLNACSLRAVTT